MITIREIQGDEERYNWWLTIMPDVLMNITLLPKETREKLDFSVGSLNHLEKYLLENYSLEEILMSKNKVALDLYARYIGETFRRNLKDVIWEMETRQNYFGYGIPLLTKRHNLPFTKQSPLSLVGGVLDRKTGIYLSSILEHNISSEV
jgi:hypothetical protein